MLLLGKRQWLEGSEVNPGFHSSNPSDSWAANAVIFLTNRPKYPRIMSNTATYSMSLSDAITANSEYGHTLCSPRASHGFYALSH